MRACPETNSEALYAAGTTVMAIYPQTTCFYKGVIKAQPAAGEPFLFLTCADNNLTDRVFHFEAADDYQVLFEDPSYADGYSPPLQVAQRYIITVPENKKKGGK